MHRIAIALIIVAAVLALDGSLAREAFAGEAPAAASASGRPIAIGSTRTLSLLLIVEALRQTSAAPTAHKV